MHAHPYASAAFTLVTYWAVGVATTVAVADTESGLIRDHPSFGRRLCSLVVPPMALTGTVAPLLIHGHLPVWPPHWTAWSALVMVPFAGLSWAWSRTWLRRTPAARRRELGLQAVVAGLLGAIITGHLALSQTGQAWRPVVPMAIFAATVALLGSLTNFSVLALTAGLPDEVPGGPAKHLAEVAGSGLLFTVLAGIDLGLGGGAVWPEQASLLLRIWILGSLVIPGLLLLSRLAKRHLPDSWLMTAALLSAIVGQTAALLLIFLFPGLVPPFSGEMF